MNPDLFDVCGPLPSGVTVLEASAGTGKTFAIAALAARYIADGTPIERLLLVTFTKMATGELRERVRERLVASEQALVSAEAGADTPDDEVLRLLVDAPPDQLPVRRRRITQALADFDAATIATTDGFCHHMLAGLGIGGDVESDVAFVDDLGDLVEEVVDDLYLRKFHRSGVARFNRATARLIGRVAVDNPQAPVEPRSATPNSVGDLRRRLAVAVRNEMDQRERQLNVMSYGDVLTRLGNLLADPIRGVAACQRLRSRYQVVLVDEFQDTDPVQWDIVRRAFGQGGTTLVLIGDPKQAIYAFRGADVFAYLAAARTAGTRATLGVNWRSDQTLLRAYDAMFRGAHLGHPDITYRPVLAATANHGSRLIGERATEALRVRIVHRSDGRVGLTPKGFAGKSSTLDHVVQDLAADVAALLSANASIVVRDRNGHDLTLEQVRPHHLAVLVRTNNLAADVRDALERVGVPAVINGAGSVFATTVAREWLVLLEALERPSSSIRVRAAALTAFLGWTAERLVAADDGELETVYARIHRWAGLLRRNGVATLLEQITISEMLAQRLLSLVDGERRLTDLRHVGQLLHLEATSAQLGASALTGWLRTRIDKADEESASEERSRRLDTDAEAVQVLTVHRSKGLEFPIVYCPDLWVSSSRPIDFPVYHDPGAADARTIDVGGKGAPGFGDHLKLAFEEQRGEDLRLAYVALTRARHQAVVWWASSWDSRESALGRLLFAADEHGNVAAQLPEPPEEAEVARLFAEFATTAPGSISVERTGTPSGQRWTGEMQAPTALFVRTFGRRLDLCWRRTSYSAITFGAHQQIVGSEPDDPERSDENLPVLPAPTPTDVEDRSADDESILRAVLCPLAAMPGGTRVGSFVHAVFEAVDFNSVDLDAQLSAAIARQQSHRYVDVGDPADVVSGLRIALETPLGPAVDDLRLGDFTPANRLNELGFEFPLAGGDSPNVELTVADIANLLRAHLPANDALATYPDRLDDPSLAAELRGYLSGSIDLVMRTPANRFVVVDYKTNWLGRDREALSAWQYRPAALVEAMQAAHYPLQAVLYQVALHRYLRWRLADYSPERNLGGALYLFVRGMTGPDTPRIDGQPCGVFAWQPPADLVVALSNLLDSGGAR